MRRTPVIAALLALALPAVAAGADPDPGTARFAVPQRGTAAVIPTNGTGLYLPFADRRREFVVFVRLPAGNRTRKVLIRHSGPRHRCAASHRLDSGVKLATSFTAAEAGGYLTARTRSAPWRLLGKRRFCIWPTGTSGRRVRPISDVVEFSGAAIGAVMWADRSPDGRSRLRAVVTASTAFGYSLTTQGCPEVPPSADRDARPLASGLAQLLAISSSSGACDRRMDLVISRSPLGAFSMSLPASAGAAGEVRHAGFCTFEDGSLPIDEARRLIERQGCRVGREYRARSDGGRDPGDAVWALTVKGFEVRLVPQGTTVDMVVNAVR